MNGVGCDFGGIATYLVVLRMYLELVSILVYYTSIQVLIDTSKVVL